ncbi:MAG: FkbM family methyltransferase [Solirubrobacteraceae bacterium]
MTPRASSLLRLVANERYRWREAIRRSAAVTARARFVWRELARRPGAARYCLRRSGLLAHVRHGTGDVAGLSEIFLNGNYDPPAPVADVLAERASRRELRVVDLGANIGLFPLTVFERFADASVVSYEPDPENARVLDLTRAANSRETDWELVRACAGARSRTVSFLGGLHMESRVAGERETGARVPMVDVFAHLRGIDWLKIDVEGGEWEILADPRFAALQIPVIALEYHPYGCPASDPTAEVTRLLAGAGYRIEPYVERSDGLGELWALRVG